MIEVTLTPSIYIGGNYHNIILRRNKIFYKGKDITERFIKLIDSGYLDRFLENEEI